jgi:hypothetical protein
MALKGTLHQNKKIQEKRRKMQRRGGDFSLFLSIPVVPGQCDRTE